MESKKYIRVSNEFEYKLLIKYLYKRDFEWPEREYNYNYLIEWYDSRIFYIVISTEHNFITDCLNVSKCEIVIDAKKFIKPHLEMINE